MLTVAARPSPEAAIASVAYMRKNAGRHCQKMCITGRLHEKYRIIANAYTKISSFGIPGLGSILNYDKAFGFICQTPLG